MAKITITIEDTFDGKVKVVCDPTFEHIIQQLVSENNLTAAHGYALKCLNVIRDESKKRGKLTIEVPRLLTS